MRRILLNLTASLDGFIADGADGIDWLAEMPAEIPEDYLRLMDSVDTLIMGRKTYEVSLALPGGTEVFEGQRVIVFTSARDLEPRAGVEFVAQDPVAFTAALRESEGGTIWLFGGGQLATALSDAGLVDEYLIAVQPVLLGDGVSLWRSPHGHTQLELIHATEWPGGVVELRYRRRA